MVSILIVTYNSAGTIGDCLRSLTVQTWKDFEVVLVDNNSTDDTREVVGKLKGSLQYPFRTHFLDHNPGFAGGNLVALEDAHGSYIGLLNPDTIAAPNWLEEVVKVLDRKIDVGICASKMIAYDTKLIDCAGDGFSVWLKGFKRGEGERPDSFSEPGYVFGASAGAALYRRSMIEVVGFLDSDYFLMHEDTDYNVRAQLAGWKVFYASDALVYHKVRSSIGRMSDTAIYYSLRNIEYVRIKNIPAAILLRRSLHLFLYGVFEFIYFVLRHGKIRLYVRAKVSVLRGMPVMLKKRAAVLRLRKVSDAAFTASFTAAFEKRFLSTYVRKFFVG